MKMKRWFSTVLALVFCLGLMPGLARDARAAESATDVPYIERSWNGNTVMEEEKTAASCTVVGSGTTYWGGSSFKGGWYVVNTDVTISGSIKVVGDVRLILCDGATLTAGKGIVFSGIRCTRTTPCATASWRKGSMI